MGCDIHCYIEYSNWTDREGEPYWQCFGGRYNPGRDYTMFDILAGVRGEEHTLFEPRGIPKGKLSYEVEGDLYCYVNDEYAGQDGYVSTENAEAWARHGSELINDADGKITRVEHPDWHSHSWLTCDEVAQVIARYITDTGSDYPYAIGWDAILAAMRAFEERDCKTRLVFWFDN